MSRGRIALLSRARIALLSRGRIALLSRGSGEGKGIAQMVKIINVYIWVKLTQQ